MKVLFWLLSELFQGIETTQPDIDYAYEDLPDVRDQSGLIDVKLQDEDIVARLTADGETLVAPETGTVGSAGGTDHDAVLMDTEQALTERGFSVEILEQDGSEQPDAIATHPDHDVVFNIEAETTTPDRPAKVLQNLKRAHEADRIPIFVVRPGDTDTQWATRVENILSPPLQERADGVEQFYNCDELVMFGGGATAHGGVTAVRPRTSDSNRTVWTRAGGDRVLSDGETEFARVPDEGPVSKDAVPAYYSYDRETGQYTVYQPGDTCVYDSKDDFEGDWIPVKRPFIPDVELPDADVPCDSYIVLILPADGSPLIFHQGETHTLSESPDYEDLWPRKLTAGPTQSEGSTTAHSEETPSGGDISASPERDESVDIDPSGDGVEAFTAMYVRQADGVKVPQEDLFQAYSNWADQHDIDGTNKGWFTRKLRNVISLDTDRSRVDGDRVQFYIGLTLTEEGRRLLDQ